MTHASAWRGRAALTAASAVALTLLTPGAAGAAGGVPVTPTDLYNAGQACSADPAAPVVLKGATGLGGPGVMGIPSHTDPSVTNLNEEFRYWPVSAPEQTGTVTRRGAYAGEEATGTLPVLADGLTYAWQARTVDPGNGAASDWTAACYVTADNTAPAAAPSASSPNYPENQWTPGGTPVQFDFSANGDTDVVGFQYTWQGGFVGGASETGPHGVPIFHSVYEDPEHAVRADTPGGSATVHLVPPAGSSGPIQFQVRSLDAAGNASPIRSYWVVVNSTSPTVSQLSHSPLFGKPTDFRLTPDQGVQAASPVVSYTVTDTTTHSSTVVPAGADGTAETTLVLNNPAGNSFEVTSKSANGWVSSKAQWSRRIDTTPTVTSTDFPEFDLGGAVGTPGTFHLAPKIPGTQIAGYTYDFGWGTEAVTVKAGPHGEADFTFTPTASGWYDLQVYATTKDGLRLSTGVYTFIVN